MFQRRRRQRRHGSRFGLLGTLVAGGLALASVVPALRKRAFRATTILKKDHYMVRGLFRMLQQTTNPSIRKSIFEQIENRLAIHSQIEKDIFYPAVRNMYTGNAESLIDEAMREHQQIDELCRQASTTDPNSFEFMSRCNELRAAIDEHVDTEENEIFTLVSRTMSAAELEHLGRRIHDRRSQLKERTAA